MELNENKHNDRRLSSENLRAQVFAAISASYLCISAGNVLGYTSSAIPSMKESQFEFITNVDISWIGSLAPLGALFGSFITVFFIKYFGTRKTILFFALPLFLMSWLAIGTLESLEMIFFGRFLGGLACGITIATAPVYITDVVSLKRRGTLGILPNSFLTIGIFISYIIGAFLDWRGLAITCGFITFPALILLVATPDTPSWLIKTQQYEKGAKIIEKFHGKSSTELESYNETQESQPEMQEITNPSDDDDDDDDFDQRANDLTLTKDEHLTEIDLTSQGSQNPPHPTSKNINEEETSQDGDENINSTIIFSKVKYWIYENLFDRAFLLTLILSSLPQLVGINFVTFYGVKIFKSSIQHINPNVPSILFAATQVTSTVLTANIVEIFGRKKLLTTSCLFVCLSSATLGINFYFSSASLNSYQGSFVISLIALALYVFFFCLGLGAITWIIVVEILRQETKHVQNPILIGCMWFSSFLVTYLFPLLELQIGLHYIFGIFSMIALAGCIFIFIFVPETKNKSSQEIRAMFDKKKLGPVTV